MVRKESLSAVKSVLPGDMKLSKAVVVKVNTALEKRVPLETIQAVVFEAAHIARRAGRKKVGFFGPQSIQDQFIPLDKELAEKDYQGAKKG